MMTRNINRYKMNNKGKKKKIIDKIKKGKLENKLIELIFPVIHGLDNNTQKEYEFKNIIEAREYLNDKECYKNVIDTCKRLLKENVKDLEELNITNLETLKSSVTLFNYITNPEITSLLTFRNYDKKLIKKVFTENKEHKIFKKILDKYFDGKLDEQTILIIESEIFEYSRKNNSLKNINENYLNLAEDILIKYSNISPIIIDTYNKKEQKKKIKEFINSLNYEEYALFCKFNLNKNIIKKAKIYKNKIKEKIAIFSLTGIMLLSGVSVATLKKSLSNDVIVTNKVATETVKKEQKKEEKKEQEVKEETKENNITTETPSTLNNEEQKNENIERPFVTPTGIGNELIVQIAAAQVGNVGGEIYWRWYGFNSRMPWCGIFISWIANQAGISTDTIPKFAKVSDGLNWFIRRGLFRNRDYTPRSGDLIFFDYDNNGQADHVGLVKKVENGKIYTIEGNIKNDRCHELSYNIGERLIYGYGTPNY